MESQHIRNEEIADLVGKMGWLYINSVFEMQKNFMERMQKTMMPTSEEGSNVWREWASYATDWAQGLLRQTEKMQKAASGQKPSMHAAGANPWQAWASLASEFARNYMSLLSDMRKAAEEVKPGDAATGDLWNQWTACAAECTQKFTNFLNHLQKAAAGQHTAGTA